MREIKFRVWHRKEKKMYHRGYQKLTHILLCDPDEGKGDGKGRPVQRGRFEDCELLEGTGIIDFRGVEIFEGDIVRLTYEGENYAGAVTEIPDMFRSRHLHPLHSLLEKWGIPEDVRNLEWEVLGNQYEHPGLLQGKIRIQKGDLK